MRYHHEKPSIFVPVYGETYICNHPLYNRCTLFMMHDNGLAVVQQRFDKMTKYTWWGEIDPWLRNELYLRNGFKEYFDKYSGKSTGGLYPTVTVRQTMWALRMKPLRREFWETSFIRTPI